MVTPPSPALASISLAPVKTVDAVLLELARELLRDLLVLDRQGARIISTMVTLEPKERKIEANSQPTAPAPRTATTLGHAVEVEDVVGVDDALAVGLDDRELARHRADGEDDVLGGVGLLLAVRALDFDLARPGEPPAAADPVDLVLLEQELDALGVGVDDVLLALLDAHHVEGGRGDVDAEVVGLADLVEHRRRLQQRLGRDAAALQARAAELGVLLDHRHLEPELTGADAGDVAAGAAADDDHVVIGHRPLPNQSAARSGCPGASPARLPGGRARRPRAAPAAPPGRARRSTTTLPPRLEAARAACSRGWSTGRDRTP